MPSYPGLGFPLRHYEQLDCNPYPIGAYAQNSGLDSLPLMVRELAMMNVMDKITDKPDWHVKVFDDSIVSKWRKEALAIPDEELYKLATSGKLKYFEPTPPIEIPDDILNKQTFETVSMYTGPELVVITDICRKCVQELRSKAKYFEQTGIIPVIDACASIAKSDTVVTKELHEALCVAFDKLRVDQQSSPDWHPNSSEMVQDLVHPSMYPLVYGRTRVFEEECVGVEDAIRVWAGKGAVIPKEPSKTAEDEQTRQWDRSLDDQLPPGYWSENYQWLPANMAFQEDGSVRFTSYINNLHPNKFSDIYRTIEKLVETSLPLWDQCLSMATGYNEKMGAGRTTPRRALPDDPEYAPLSYPKLLIKLTCRSDECNDNWNPNNPEACAQIPVSDEDLKNEGWCRVGDMEDESDKNEYRWKFLRKPVLPEFYFSDISYAPAANTRLMERFRESGLQIIVKMASIELTPEKPDFPVGGWHIEGQMNESICGTALYYLDSDNITDTELSFRMQTSQYLNDYDGPYSVGQDSYSWMEKAFGTCLQSNMSPCLQNYGNVMTREGRLLAFPNVL
jgi:hypothetical protein